MNKIYNNLTIANLRKTDDKNQIFIVCLYLTTFFRADELFNNRKINKKTMREQIK